MVEAKTALSRDLVASYLNQLRRCGVKELHLPPDWKQALASLPAREEPRGQGKKEKKLVRVGREEQKKEARVVREVASNAVAVAPPPSLPSLPSRSFASLEEREQALEDLREQVTANHELRKKFSRAQQMVFGVGRADADILFIGEAPGEDEDREGEPFVGAAGQLLTKMIGAMGLSREEVYIANIVKYRPDMPPGSRGNRKPTSEEMTLCLPILLEQIAIIQPRVMVALGATAVEGLFILQRVGITSMRGTWKTFGDIPVMPTFHPAYLLRKESMAEKRKVWEDLMQVMEAVDLPVSDKQRSYFLSHL